MQIIFDACWSASGWHCLGESLSDNGCPAGLCSVSELDVAITKVQLARLVQEVEMLKKHMFRVDASASDAAFGTVMPQTFRSFKPPLQLPASSQRAASPGMGILPCH